MSDSGLSFSLKYDLILPPSLINTYTVFQVRFHVLFAFVCSVLCFLLPETRDASTLENIDSFNSSTTVEMSDREGKSSL